MAYTEGEEPENDSWMLDFGEWASIYRTWLSRQAEYRNEVQRIQQSTSGLAGLIKVSHKKSVSHTLGLWTVSVYDYRPVPYSTPSHSNIYEAVEGCLSADVENITTSSKAKIMDIAIWKQLVEKIRLTFKTSGKYCIK